MKFLKSEETMSPSSAEDQKDHISSLPGEVIEETFLRLSMEDAARTSCLSKTWKQCWDSFPYYLHFDQNPSSGLAPYQQFKSYMDRKLWTYMLKQLSILKFRLCMSTVKEESARDINRWISRVIEKGVKEIDFQLNLPCLYTLPQKPRETNCIEVERH
ncbi:hypothetical protein L6164_021473 [Bauhinia variegata]|uniref:Uncharacterized protein n=1 Tax=Bauhinia variegata TaxID=167791 RepID=A0ACB9N465_BAUVA|nr:hypothetical protein L6164_021473 [Bauhinia variegata]